MRDFEGKIILVTGSATGLVAAVAGKPEDIADPALFLISDAARHITGEMPIVDAGTQLGFSPLKAR